MCRSKSLAFFLLLLSWLSKGYAQIFEYHDDQGHILFSDRIPTVKMKTINPISKLPLINNYLIKRIGGDIPDQESPKPISNAPQKDRYMKVKVNTHE